MSEEDSLAKRYFMRISTRMIGVVFSMITMGMVPRMLGAASYGNFGFLMDVYQKILGFFDLGTSLAFFNKLSRRKQEKALISFYFQFAFLAACLIMLFTWICNNTVLGQKIFVDQETKYIYTAALLICVTFFKDIIQKVYDAFGLTVKFEIVELIFKIVNVSLILVFFYTQLLNLPLYFLTRFVYIVFPIVILFILLLKIKKPFITSEWRIDKKSYVSYGKEFAQYSMPLITYSFVGLILGILDRWMLQKFSGSTEQGFYTLGFQIGAVIFLFSGSFTALIGREFSIAFGEKNTEKMARTFRRYIPLLYAVTAYFILFLVAEAKTVIQIMGGEEFKDAIIPLSIILFYPLHQTYGQLSGSFYYATENTKAYRNIGIVVSFIGLFLSFLFIAPRSIYGLGMGATGLALKMIVIQIISVNILTFFNCRTLNLRFLSYLAHQFAVPAIFGLIAFFCKYLVSRFIPNIYIEFFISGLLYTFLVLVLFYSVPLSFGLDKKGRDDLINSARKKITTFFNRSK